MNLTNLLNNIPYSKNNVIIFDIDGTLLDKNRKIILKTLEFYYYCLYKQYTVYIITARSGTKRGILYTIQELDQKGINGFDKIYFPNPDKNTRTQSEVREYKKDVRNHIRNLGFNIVFCMGDQDTDYDANSGISIKVVDDGKNFFQVI